MSKLGAWGEVTATLDWCEHNYQFSHYIAEMANTFSNLFTIAIAIFAGASIASQSLPTRYVVGCAGFGLVGVGSFFFHATLTFSAQLMDELPMIYLATYNLFLLFDTERGFQLTSTRSRTLLTLVALFDILFSWSYLVNRNPVYHQVVFASLMLAVVFRVRYLLQSSETSSRVPGQARETIIRLFTSGAVIFAAGFFIWNCDNIFCDVLTRWKATIGWPVAFLLEGHSWWHILTGHGSYLLGGAIHYLTLCVKDDHEKYAIGYVGPLPRIVRIKSKTK